MEAHQEWAEFEGALKVKLKVFEGPLDLLLHLIKSNKIDIYDIPMAEITAQYLEYLNLMKELNLDIASEFMIMAATLMHIKSRLLLPVPEEGTEEEDPRAELVAQLLEYQRYKEASRNLKEMLAQRSLFIPRRPGDSPAAREEVTIDVSLFHLLQVFREVISTVREGPAMIIDPDKFTVVDKMRLTMEIVEKRQRCNFKDLFDVGALRQEIVAAFLAILELVRLRMIRLFQEEFGGEIFIAGAQE